MDILFLIISYTKGGRISGTDKDERMKNTKQLLVLLITLVIMITTCIPLYIRANEMLPEEENLSERTGLKSLEVQYLSEEDIPVNYSYEKKVLGSSAYETGENKEWAEYSTYFYYNQLTEEEKNFYDTLMRECLIYLTDGGDIEINSKGNCYLPGISYGNLDEDRAKNIYYNAFRYSNPQFYYLMNSLGLSSGKIYPRVYEAFTKESARQNATTGIMSVLSVYEAEAGDKVSAYDKVKTIHDELCKKVSYNKDAADDLISEQDSFSQSAYSTFIMNKTVCTGYAEAFAMICNKLGIDAIIETSETHAWNRVSLDDNWYIVDCTWDDKDSESVLYYKYFLRSFDEVLKNDQKGSHVPKSFLISFLPPCTLDCTPTDKNRLPGVLPSITETSEPPKLTDLEGSFTLSAEDGARIYYTLDGSTPAEGQGKSYLYRSAVSVPYGAEIKAYAVVDQKKNSTVESFTIEGIEAPFYIYPSENTIIVGGSAYLNIIRKKDFENDVEWSSSDNNIAVVADGWVTGISKGTAVITAKSGLSKSTANVIVVDKMFKVGKKTTLKADKKINKVEVSDKTIAKATKKGKNVIVKGKKAGTVTITVYDKKGEEVGRWIVKVE